MTDTFTISVAGTPRPQPRPRRVRAGHFVSSASKTVKLWRLAIERALTEALEGRDLPLFAGACHVVLRFSGANEAADVDNLSKNVLDVMQKAGVFRNDRLVTQLKATKAAGRAPGVVIEVYGEAPQEPVIYGPVAERPDWL